MIIINRIYYENDEIKIENLNEEDVYLTITPEQLAACGSESGHQKALFCWAALNQHLYPQLKWLYAVPNGFYAADNFKGYGSGQKAKMKAEGLRDGVPDVVLPWPQRWEYISKYGTVNYCALYIEMKREKYRNAKNGGCSDEQLEWLDYLNGAGYKAVVCYSWIEARNIIIEYLR